MDTLFTISPIYASITVILSPFIAAILQAILGKKNTSGNIALVAISISTIISALSVFIIVWNSTIIYEKVAWFTIGNSTFYLGILLNNLTAIMQLLVCVIALPVHIYSRAYMKGDPGLNRYWMYLSFFCFAMLGLTVSINLLQMYVFWELVGFASFLLIGFWFQKPAAAQASKKAFIINRIGDLGFLIGIALVYTHFGTLDLLDLFGESGLIANGMIRDASGTEIPHNTTWLTLSGLAFFLGAMAKSAQFPLHIWLPEAMEGPTSVSSLIHAATMVAAGVFLLASIFPLFNETVLLIITCIGTITAATAALFASVQYDIKRILAFSTVSQLGFMMVGVGIGAWDAAMFHLITHAFFKCLLFLCAGAVIHELNHFKDQTKQSFDPQDLRNMGGLRKLMPKTFILMTIASLSLAGFPLSSGYLSKDSIIVAAFEWASHKQTIHLIVPIVLITVSILTAFYIGRLMFTAYFGNFRFTTYLTNNKASLQDASKAMLWPMLFLAVCSLFPLYSYNPIDYHSAWILTTFQVEQHYPSISSAHLIIPLILVIGASLSGVLAWKWYVKKDHSLGENDKQVTHDQSQGDLIKAQPLAGPTETGHTSQIILRFEHGLNHFIKIVFIRAVEQLSKLVYTFDKNIVDGATKLLSALVRYLSVFIHWIDRWLVDGFVNLVANITYYIGHLIRQVQNGQLQTYLGFALTVVVLGIIYLLIK